MLVFATRSGCNLLNHAVHTMAGLGSGRSHDDMYDGRSAGYQGTKCVDHGDAMIGRILPASRPIDPFRHGFMLQNYITSGCWLAITKKASFHDIVFHNC